jgi:hypothetical protein
MLGVGVQAVDTLERGGATVARQVGNEHPPPTGKQGRELGEVDRRAAEPVHDDEGIPLPSDVPPGPHARDPRGPHLESPKERCGGHGRTVSCAYGPRRRTERLSSVANRKDELSPPRSAEDGLFCDLGKESSWRTI